MSPRWGSTLRQTDWLTVSRNVTLTGPSEPLFKGHRVPSAEVNRLVIENDRSLSSGAEDKKA
jgi:hypothetical protein